MKLTIIIIFCVLVFMFLFIWLMFASRKRAIKDWDTLHDLEKRANNLKTKEEIQEFHKEFIDKANKIYNSHIHLRLNRIDGYIRGLYKQFEK